MISILFNGYKHNINNFWLKFKGKTNIIILANFMDTIRCETYPKLPPILAMCYI